VLIWGMDADTARQWGRHWQQNAVLWSDADARPGFCGCADFFDSTLRFTAIKNLLKAI
jgi:hypothetical protein